MDVAFKTLALSQWNIFADSFRLWKVNNEERAKEMKNRMIIMIAAIAVCGLALFSAAAFASPVTKVYICDGFDTVYIFGAWRNVTIEQGNEYRVEITAEENDVNDLCQQNGSVLKLGKNNDSFLSGFFKSWISGWRNHATDSAKIVMPALVEIKADGIATCVIDGFKEEKIGGSFSGSLEVILSNCFADEISIDCNGVGEVKIENCTVKKLTTDSSGFVDIFAKNTTAINLEVRESGFCRLNTKACGFKNALISRSGFGGVHIDKLTGGSLNIDSNGPGTVEYVCETAS